MDFLTALKAAKKQKCGLRPEHWNKPFRDRAGDCNMTYATFVPNKRHLYFVTRGTLRIMKHERPTAVIISLRDYLGKWSLVTEAELNAAHDRFWKAVGRREAE